MKKITKFLDSVMGGIKRTCIAKAVAVFAVASIAINANAQIGVNPVADFEGLDGLTGKTFTELMAAKVGSSDAFPTDKSKIFFLYNVKSGKFLTAGSYWGTHVAIADYGKQMCIVSGRYSYVLNFRMDMETPQGQYVQWMGGYDATDPDNGVYVDRGVSEGYGWRFEKVEDAKNTYKLYTYPIVNNTVSSVKYYLCSNQGQTDVLKSCEAYTTTQITQNGLTGYDEWRFFTYDQIYTLQKQKADKMNKKLELSFKLKAPGFERGNKEITNWKTYSFKDDASSLWRFGLEHMYYKTPTTDANENYDVNTFKSNTSFVYTFDGVEYKADDPEEKPNNSKGYRRDLAKYTCASATQVAGMIYQDVEVTLPGSYVIECKGYSTTSKAVLFAGVVDPKSETNTMYNKHLYKTVLNQVSGMTAEEKTALHTSEMNMDYAGKAFLGSNKYINQVTVIVPQEVFDNNPGKTIKIRLGVMIGDYTKKETPTAGEWTVFDDFRLLYASKTTNADLILDEYRDNLSYLVNSSDLFQNKTLHLNKEFVLNKWNTFVLPVNLTRNQVWSAFGGTTRLAKLSNLTETAIEFESVDLASLTDEAPAIEAYQPYIIFPAKDVDVTPAYTGNVTVNNKVETVTIAANHYVIPKVSLPLTTDGKSKDFSKMNQDNWTTTVIGGNEDIKAYGTFARTFGTGTQKEDGTWDITNKGTIIEGRDNLVNCYFFDKGKMYHSDKRPRGLRGFSCWFKLADGASPSQDVQYTLDGVTQSGTTGIEDILADYEQPVSRYADGIYNLNGQLVKQGNSTAGLPSGMYIVNGKKCIVR